MTINQKNLYPTRRREPPRPVHIDATKRRMMIYGK
jgi:hypothetical protein